jgi:hypothetical protein
MQQDVPGSDASGIAGGVAAKFKAAWREAIQCNVHNPRVAGALSAIARIRYVHAHA